MFLELIMAQQHQLLNTCIAYRTKCFTPPSFNLMFSQDIEENNLSLHDIPDQRPRLNTGHNRRHPPCGTRHHYGV